MRIAGWKRRALYGNDIKGQHEAPEVLIEIPMGPSATVRAADAADGLSRMFADVGAAFGHGVRTVVTNGRQPIGRKICPAIEVRDVRVVLTNAPMRLPSYATVRCCWPATCSNGRAGYRPRPGAPNGADIADQPGKGGCRGDNRHLARLAELADAPGSPTAGLVFHVLLGTVGAAGQPLVRIHTTSAGQLTYALAYADSKTDIILIAERA